MFELLFLMYRYTSPLIKEPKFSYRCNKRCAVFLHPALKFDFENIFKFGKKTIKTKFLKEIRKKIHEEDKETELDTVYIFNWPHKQQCCEQSETVSMQPESMMVY